MYDASTARVAGRTAAGDTEKRSQLHAKDLGGLTREWKSSTGGIAMSERVKYTLDESQIPEAWYNILADAPTAAQPVLHPGTKEPVTPEDLAPLFPMDLIMQEMSSER